MRAQERTRRSDCADPATAADLDRHLAMPHLKPLFGRLGDLVARPVDVRRFVMLSQMAD